MHCLATWEIFCSNYTILSGDLSCGMQAIWRSLWEFKNRSSFETRASELEWLNFRCWSCSSKYFLYETWSWGQIRTVYVNAGIKLRVKCFCNLAWAGIGTVFKLDRDSCHAGSQQTSRWISTSHCCCFCCRGLTHFRCRCSNSSRITIAIADTK